MVGLLKLGHEQHENQAVGIKIKIFKFALNL